MTRCLPNETFAWGTTSCRSPLRRWGRVWGCYFRSPVVWGTIPATLCCLVPNEPIFGMLREKNLTWLLVLSHLRPWGHRSVA